MTKKTKENVTKVAAIAIPYDGQHSCVVLPRSFLKKRVFVVLKSQWDEFQRQQEKRNTA